MVTSTGPNSRSIFGNVFYDIQYPTIQNWFKFSRIVSTIYIWPNYTKAPFGMTLVLYSGAEVRLIERKAGESQTDIKAT